MNLDIYKKNLLEILSRLDGKPLNSHSLRIEFDNLVFEFLDSTHELYFNASLNERMEISQIIQNHDRDEKDIKEGDTTICVPFRYVADKYGIRVIKELKATGDVVWLMRGLTTISMVNNIGFQSRNEEILARLFVAAEEKGLNPKPIFKRFSEISSNKSAKPENISTSELIIATPNKAYEIVDQLRKWSVIE
jgi:hypothetical protein